MSYAQSCRIGPITLMMSVDINSP